MNQAEVKARLIEMHPADIQAWIKKEGRNFKNYTQLGTHIDVHRQHVSITISNLGVILDALAQELSEQN